MDVLLSIGDFSKMTYLSVKALRHYHDVGLLEPADIDPATGYRRYALGQVATAQAIRRFRDLDMPIDEVRAVLGAPDEPSRNRAILAHLERMQAQLEQTQQAVASLQRLLGGEQHTTAAVEIRRIPATSALAVHRTIEFTASFEWLYEAYEWLHALAAEGGLEVSGVDAATYADDLFEAGFGRVSAYVPVATPVPAIVAGPLPLTDETFSVLELPAITAAVLRHDGPFDELDQTYGALGTIVAERGIGGPGPVRELYLTPTSTEVCWPVTTGATP